LIAARRQSYEVLAHCTLPVAELRDISRDASPSAEAFLKMIQDKLEGAR
jgi:hypothetical protein